jgi:HKD family nuclease
VSPDISEMILCSGFFQQNKKFSAGDDFNNINLNNKKTIKLVGVYNYLWKSSYDNFHNSIISNNPSFLNVEKYRIPSMGWHAKVMIGKQNESPVIATIGSSNITGRAFGISNKFNYESDVVIWDESVKNINKIIDESFDDNVQNSGEVIISNYADDWRNGNLSLNEKVLELEKEIFKVAKLAT